MSSFLEALTHNEIATLLEVLIGTLSPDMVAKVLDQLQADADIMAAMPEWMSLDDGYDVDEHVTACLLEWEWLQVQEDTSDVFLLVQRLREWEEESAYAKLAHGTFLTFFNQLPDEQQQHIFAGLSSSR